MADPPPATTPGAAFRDPGTGVAGCLSTLARTPSGRTRPGNPGEHWGTTHPEDQPPRAAVTGLRRQVLEARLRLGPDATPDAVAAELRATGVDIDPAEVAGCFNDPYCQPDGE
jgi:hypothetical protein